VAPLDSGIVQLWDLARSPRPRTISISPHVNAVAVSPDGRWITVAAHRNLEIGSWPGNRFRTLVRSPDSAYSAVAFDRDSVRVAAAAYDGKNSHVSVWRIPRADDEASVEEQTPVAMFDALGLVNALAFSHDGTRLVAAGSDGAVRVWALSGSSPAAILRGHHGSANAVAFSPDDTEVVSGGHDGTVRLWELAEGGGKSVTIGGPGGAVTNVGFTSGGDLIAVGTSGARVWDCDFCGAAERVLARARRMATRQLTAEERALYLHER
jgi:WD40 repeat protein